MESVEGCRELERSGSEWKPGGLYNLRPVPTNIHHSSILYPFLPNIGKTIDGWIPGNVEEWTGSEEPSVSERSERSEGTSG